MLTFKEYEGLDSTVHTQASVHEHVRTVRN